MKKVLTVLTCALLMAAMISCGSTEEGSGENDDRDIVIHYDENSGGSSSGGSNEITIYFEGGQSDENLVVDEYTGFADIIQSTPTKEGYLFAGWYSNKGLTDYIDPDNITQTQLKRGTAYAKWITVPEMTTYSVRSEEVKITDSGRENQQMDIVRISKDYNVTDLLRAGYRSLTVSITFEASEKHDGYQHVFLYSNTSCATGESSLLDYYDKYVIGESSDDPSLLWGKKFEHGSGVLDTSWGTQSYEITVNLDDLIDELYIRYGASGKNEDSWFNKNVVVTVIPNR
ncbi:MAG: InlB B-repeat-containing protein [Clostridia bacterium]|nr:InlB B-repeat-containing protein [Clostridia bacterium]